MTPIICKSKGPGWSVYLVPSTREHRAQLDADEGRGGSVARPFNRLAYAIENKADALTTLKDMRVLA